MAVGRGDNLPKTTSNILENNKATITYAICQLCVTVAVLEWKWSVSATLAQLSISYEPWSSRLAASWCMQ